MRSHREGDEQRFRRTAEEIIEDARRRRHGILADELEAILDEPVRTSLYYHIGNEWILAYSTNVIGDAAFEDIIPANEWDDMLDVMRSRGMTPAEEAQLLDAVNNRRIRMVERTYAPYATVLAGKVETYYYIQGDPVRDAVIMEDEHYMTVYVGWDHTIRGYQRMFEFDNDSFEFTGVVDNFRFEDMDGNRLTGPFATEDLPNITRVYDTWYSKPQQRSLIGMGLWLDGRMRYNEYTSVGFGPRGVRLYFDELARPDYSVITRNELGFELDNPRPYKIQIVIFDQNDPGLVYVVEIDANPTVLTQWADMNLDHVLANGSALVYEYRNGIMTRIYWDKYHVQSFEGGNEASDRWQNNFVVQLLSDGNIIAQLDLSGSELQEMIAEIRTKYAITDEEALYIKQVTEEKAADPAIRDTVQSHREDRIYLEGAYRGQVNGEIQETYDDLGRYEELSDPKYTDTGGIFDIMAVTVIQTHLIAA